MNKAKIVVEWLFLLHTHTFLIVDLTGFMPPYQSQECHVCRIDKVRVTADIKQYLPSFLPSLLFGPASPMDKLAVDNERSILYAVTSSNSIQARPSCRTSMQNITAINKSIVINSPVW